MSLIQCTRSGNRERRLYRGLCSAISRSSRTSASSGGGALDAVDPVRERHHLAHPGAGLRRREVGADPGAQVLRGADVEHPAALVAEEVDPRRVRELLGEVALAALRGGHARAEGLQLLEGLHAEVAEPLHEAVQDVDRGAGVGERPVVGGRAAPNTTASELSLQLGASSRVITRRASMAVSSTSKRGHGRPCALREVLEEADVEGCVVGDQDAPVGELEELREHLLDRGRAGHHRVGDAGQHRDERRDGLVGVDERLELTEDLATADLDGADLGDHRPAGRRAAGGLEVDDAERHVAQGPTQLVEGALRLPARGASRLPWPSHRPCAAISFMASTLEAATDNRTATRHTLETVVPGPIRAPPSHPEVRRGGRPARRRATRWRCGACGNLTRFDVTQTRRTTEFWHFDLAGDHRVESSSRRPEAVAKVTCRWCGRSDAVELVARARSGRVHAVSGRASRS